MFLHPSGDPQYAINPVLSADSFSDSSPLASCRADVAVIARFAELYQVPQPVIQTLVSEVSRRKQRILPAEAMEKLKALGLRTQLFRGDLKDVQETRRPVVAIMNASIYLLVLMVERRVVVAQAGHGLAPVTIKRADFSKNWSQGWLANV